MDGMTMNKLKEMLCYELEEIASKGDLSHGDLDVVHKLTDTIKNIDKIEYLDEGGYSRDGGWHAEGVYSRTGYGNGNSYSRNGMNYQRSHSMDDGKGMFMEYIDEMMQDSRLSSDERNTLKKAKEILRR